MKRLTMRLSADDKDKSAAYVGQHKQYETGDVPCELNTAAVREVLCRLAEYEDTGLTPEQVALLVSPDMKEMAQLMKECLEMIQGGAEVQIFGLPAERVLQLVEQEKAGGRTDVMEVKHGYWKDTGDPILDNIYGVAECSICGYEYAGNNTNYCPNCGAKMDGDGNV